MHATWSSLPRIATLIVTAVLACAAIDAPADVDGQRGGFLHEGESRFLPGVYYFEKGNEYFRRGRAEAAIEMWTISAGWAMKDAQYNLGIAYFKGEGIAADRPRGLAWLALAAERKDPAFSESLAAAWGESSPEEHARANAIWRELRARHADAIALPRAQRRFDLEMAQLTGSRVGAPGHASVWTPEGTFDGASLRKRLNAQADVAFGRVPRGRVDVGPLQALDAPAPEAHEH